MEGLQKRIKWLKVAIVVGLAASVLQVITTFGHGILDPFSVPGAWLKGIFVEAVIGLLTGFVAIAMTIKFKNTGLIWISLIVGVIVSMLANMEYDLGLALKEKARIAIEIATLEGKGDIELTKIKMMAIPTSDNLIKYLNWLDYVRAFIFSGIVPFFVFSLSVCIMITEKQMLTVKDEEQKRLDRNAYMREYQQNRKTRNTQPQTVEISEREVVLVD